jgi:FtsH-binding integral membrane protein
MTEIAYRSASQVNDAMLRVYNYMFLAILISGLVSYFVGSSPELLQFFFTGWIKWIVIFAPLAAVIGISIALNAGPPKEIAVMMLAGFAALMGLSFATIFAVFTLGSIVMAFMSAAVLFGTMSLYGYFTKRDLTSIGQFLFIGLIAVVIASIVNIFVGSSVMTMVISAIAIIVFTGLTAYDTQKIRELVSSEAPGSAEVMGALTLYLDFINLFLSLLQLFGGKKD